MQFLITRLRVKGVRLDDRTTVNLEPVFGDLNTHYALDQTTGEYVIQATVFDRSTSKEPLLPPLNRVELGLVSPIAIVLRGFERQEGETWRSGFLTGMAATAGREEVITHHDLMLLQASKEPFSRPGWIYELKYDGFRCLVRKEGQRIWLLSRNGRDMSEPFPELVSELSALPDVVLDSELVVLDELGRPQFERLCYRALHTRRIGVDAAARTEPAVIFAFDLLSVEGRDFRNDGTVKRKAVLEKLLAGGNRARIAQHIEQDGKTLFEFAQGMDLEGIVAKKADAPYVSGRSWSWLKVKTEIGKQREAKRMER